MRVYPTSNRNFLVKAVNADLVLYDVTFPLDKETDLDRKEREIRGVPADLQRATHHNMVMDTAAFATMLAQQGWWLQTRDKAAQEVIKVAIKEAFNG